MNGRAVTGGGQVRDVPPGRTAAGVGGPIAAALAVALGALTMAAAAVVASGGAIGQPGVSDSTASPSTLAVADIPARYLALYESAGSRYGVDWSVLAGIGKVECDHGRDRDPSCTVVGAVNRAGAGGPMQFLASTWQEYGVDGDGDGRSDRWDPADAIYGAANYLRASGAPADYASAIFAYNHDLSYVREVEGWARRYREAGNPRPAVQVTTGSLAAMQRLTATPIRVIPGNEATLAPGDGHLAQVPADVPLTVAAMIVAGNELQSVPYGPNGHPDPVEAPDQDCSSTINFLLYRAGVRPLSEILRKNPVAQDYVHWGDPGPGRWVTIYATDSPTPHVFATVAGLRIDTSHDGTDNGPNRNQDGPRWRLFGGIPAWAHWSVRHPPGL